MNSNSKEKSAKKFVQLLEIMEKLRGPQGCPWDKEQNHKTLIPYLVEETYEVIDALENKNKSQFEDELGDLLFQVIFHSQIAQEENQFDINGVLQAIIDKLTRRHPHVFGDTKVKDASEVVHNWEQIKASEKMGDPSLSILSEIPVSLPSLLKAYKLGKKVSQVGFDWPSLDGVFSKVKEEIEELQQAIQNQNKMEILEELGDLLFSISNLARFLKINPEEALRQTNEKFSRRFQFIEKKLREEKKSFKNTSLEEMDKIWNEAKLHEKNFPQS